MQIRTHTVIEVSHHTISSRFLVRDVTVDIYYPTLLDATEPPALLLINDGQDLHAFHFAAMLEGLRSSGMIRPLVCVGIHAGPERRQEYGTASRPDYEGRGAKAGLHQQFVLEEVLPLVHAHTGIETFVQKAYAGFSLGGLAALDTVWAHPHIFSIAGVFSGSLWWRSHPLGEGYDDDQHRIMQCIVRGEVYKPGLRFYFTTGSLDETADRNNNGIIDSIDDTMAMVQELHQKGYAGEQELQHINYDEGRHDVATWGKAMPAFLLWGWGK